MFIIEEISKYVAVIWWNIEQSVTRALIDDLPCAPYRVGLTTRDIMKIYLVTAVVLLIGACSNKAIYDNIQLNNRNDCAKLPPSQYNECIERASRSYDEYERERKETLEK